MKVSHHGNTMAVLLGRKLPKRIYQITALNIYQSSYKLNTDSYSNFELKASRSIRIPRSFDHEDSDISINFEFSHESENLIFFIDEC